MKLRQRSISDVGRRIKRAWQWLSSINFQLALKGHCASTILFSNFNWLTEIKSHVNPSLVWRLAH
jgi:hypothetical protein